MLIPKILYDFFYFFSLYLVHRTQLIEGFRKLEVDPPIHFAESDLEIFSQAKQKKKMKNKKRQ